MRLVLLLTTTILVLASAQLESRKQKINTCDVTLYEGIQYKNYKDILVSKDTGKQMQFSSTLDACIRKCMVRKDCKAINFLQPACYLLGSGLSESNVSPSQWYRNPGTQHAVIKCNLPGCGSVGCGRQAPLYRPIINKKLRIVGGKEAMPHSWPWLVKSLGCGANLLRVKNDVEKSDILLTAAHCVVKGGKTLQVFGVAGKHHVKVVDDGEKAWTSAEIRIHPQYDNESIENDIAIIKLTTPLDYSDTIRPICLPKLGEELPVGKTCIAAGWGVDFSPGLRPDALQQVLSPVHDGDTCRKRYFSSYVENIHICSGNLDGSSNSCSGDSGGMLACEDNDGSWKLYGLQSWGTPDCKEYPTIYTRVSTFVDWINTNMNEMTSIK